jgi:hypothetical protein
MATQTDFLTTNKNGVVAINNAAQTISSLLNSYGYFQGQNTSGAKTAQTVIATGSGYLVNFAVVVAGAAGTINNTATTGGIAATNALCTTPATVGVYPVGARFTDGLVVNPGAGQTLVVTYSLD